MNDSTPNAGVTANEILDIAESWSNSDLEHRTAVVVLRDDNSGKSYFHYAGAPTDIAKAVVDLMRADEAFAHTIFAAVTLTAHKSLPLEEIEHFNSAAQRIADMRRNGATHDEIERELFGS
ncbi:MAG: hypothetical protein HDT34_02810 [Clostridiales bacterium]|nr:hypothetical protein [Clostridiales bacterium]